MIEDFTRTDCEMLNNNTNIGDFGRIFLPVIIYVRVEFWNNNREKTCETYSNVFAFIKLSESHVRNRYNIKCYAVSDAFRKTKQIRETILTLSKLFSAAFVK